MTQIALTTLAARDSIREKAPSLRERIYAYIAMWDDEGWERGVTRDEIEHGLNISGNTVRPRVKELIAEGRIVETKQVRKTRSGRAAYVLRVKQ